MLAERTGVIGDAWLRTASAATSRPQGSVAGNKTQKAPSEDEAFHLSLWASVAQPQGYEREALA